MPHLDLSVHQLVDFLLRTGDIDNRVFNRSSMNEGTFLHSLYQAKQSDNYLSEYPLSITMMVDDIEIYIHGRADGIIKKSKNKYIIDEIKTTVMDLEQFYSENKAWHLGQAEVYAYMFIKEKELDNIEIRLTYISQKKHHDKFVKTFSYSFIELENKIYNYLNDYLLFYNIVLSLRNMRNESLAKLDFPFVKYRNGQYELTKYTYAIASKGGRLFVEAPTGIGKTMSTLYPAVKSLINDDESKIFYLTAKSSGKLNAYNATKIINDKGAKLSSIVITAKEKICFCKDKACNPDECPYAKGYYSKITEVIKYAILSHRLFDSDIITRLAYDYQVCPFELELDLSLYLDVVICDYNYIFDPISYMHRYFDEDATHHLALIDEAHNLVDRSREMYSQGISEEDFLLAKQSVKTSSYKPLKTILGKINKYFKGLKESYVEENTLVPDLNEDTIKLFTRFTELMTDINKNNHQEVSKELLSFYLDVNRFIKIYEIINDAFIYNIKRSGKYSKIELICLDASKYLKAIISRLKGAIYFSATLTPINYYINTLGGRSEEDPVLKLDSPFPKENFLLLVAPKISVKYKNREHSYHKVASYIDAFIKNKIGNYLVYLPSYEYLANLKPYLINEEIDYFYQEKDMDENSKEEFISHFNENPTKTTIGFAILGGSFAEGIDLVSDRLIGAIIVGIGMPRINFISDQIVDYYDHHELNGRNYAYIYPGMNKVMQAVGRVIRSEEDKGAVLLIDERYTTNQYQDLFKKEWSNYEIVLNEIEVSEAISRFYNK